MKNQYIKFSVEHQVIQRTDTFFVVGGSVNYLKARFSFCDDWSDEEQIAVFTGGGHSYAVTITNGECVVPWEVLRLKKFYVSCMAGERITSNAVSVKVCPCGIGDDLEKYLAPTPTVFDEKIQKAVEQFMKENSIDIDLDGVPHVYTGDEMPTDANDGDLWIHEVDDQEEEQPVMQEQMQDYVSKQIADTLGEIGNAEEARY